MVFELVGADLITRTEPNEILECASHPPFSDLITHVAGSGEFTYSDHRSLCVGLFCGVHGLGSSIEVCCALAFALLLEETTPTPQWSELKSARSQKSHSSLLSPAESMVVTFVSDEGKGMTVRR